MRLSDDERQEALDALGEHVRTGRLDIDEFGTRSAKVSAAKTRRDLAPLFDDLPDPTPSALISQAKPIPPARERPAPAPRFSAGAVPIAVLVAVVLFFTVARGFWMVFLIPVAVALIAGTFSGGRRSG
jgi:hypothetical protein